jgi:hypothetical protein
MAGISGYSSSMFAATAGVYPLYTISAVKFAVVSMPWSENTLPSSKFVPMRYGTWTNLPEVIWDDVGPPIRSPSM